MIHDTPDSLHRYQILHCDMYNKLEKIMINMLAINIKAAKAMKRIVVSEFSFKSITLIFNHSLVECQYLVVRQFKNLVRRPNLSHKLNYFLPL